MPKKHSAKRTVTRAEFERVLSLLEDRTKLLAMLQFAATIQFERMDDLEAELMRLRQTSTSKVPPPCAVEFERVKEALATGQS